MKRIICYCGPIASGKTTARRAHPEHRSLPTIEIARDLSLCNSKLPGAWARLWVSFRERLANALEGNDVVVVEGQLWRGSISRNRLMEWAMVRGIKLEWVEVSAPRDERIRRLRKLIDGGDSNARGRLRAVLQEG